MKYLRVDSENRTATDIHQFRWTYEDLFGVGEQFAGADTAAPWLVMPLGEVLTNSFEQQCFSVIIGVVAGRAAGGTPSQAAALAA